MTIGNRVTVRAYDPVTTGWTIKQPLVATLIEPDYCEAFQRLCERNIAKVSDDPTVVGANRITFQVIGMQVTPMA